MSHLHEWYEAYRHGYFAFDPEQDQKKNYLNPYADTKNDRRKRLFWQGLKHARNDHACGFPQQPPTFAEWRRQR